MLGFDALRSSGRAGGLNGRAYETRQDNPRNAPCGDCRRRRAKSDEPDAAVHAAQAFARARLGPFKIAAIYHPMGAELDPYPLAAVLERLGARIALPVSVARDAPLVFRLMSETATMPVDAVGTDPTWVSVLVKSLMSAGT